MSRNNLPGGPVLTGFLDTQYAVRIAYRTIYRLLTLFIVTIALVAGLTGCSEEATPYRPPTIAVQATRLMLATITPTTSSLPINTPLPTSTPTCTDDLTFLEDITLPDGAAVKPGQSLDKRWLVENSGTCNWDERYHLKFASGAELGAPIDQALFPARSGAKATLRIVFTAPAEPGTYQSAWQAYDPLGQPFGDPIYLQVVVSTSVP